MTESAVSQTPLKGGEAGKALAADVLHQLSGRSPDALIVFASPDQNHQELLAALDEGAKPGVMVGCSSAGEFSSGDAGVGTTCVVALRAGDMRFHASLGRGLREDRAEAARQIVGGLRGTGAHEFRYRSALVLTDALAGFTDDLVDRLIVSTGGVYRFFGGGAGDDARFQKTSVFHGREVHSDAAVALEILSDKPIGIGVRHGWEPRSERMRVTEASGMRLGSLNAVPAADVFEEHARSTGQTFDASDPVPFFLHNVLGVESGDGYRLRVPLAVAEDGSVDCAAEVPPGATSCIMTTSPASAAEAAREATRSALAQLDGNEPAVGLLFDCVATRLRLGKAFHAELDAVRETLGGAALAGFNTYGQIAQAEGQFSGFHNCTAVVCVIPR